MGRVPNRSYHSGGVDRNKRLYLTMGVGAAIMLVFGLIVGFALGRATAPVAEPEPAPVVETVTTMPAGVEEPVPTETIEPEFTEETDASVETTQTDEDPPARPKQTAPSDGASVRTTRVHLRWTTVSDDGPVTYAFEIQDRLPNGTWGKTQVISGLADNFYSARVLPVKRRWRVWAVDEAGNESAKTGWRTYIRKPSPVPNPTPTQPSDETT